MSQLPIYVINLARQPERLERMRERVGALGLDFERLDAVDRVSTPEEVFTRAFPEDGVMGALSGGEKACALSHRKAWRMLVDSEAPAALVLEDDANLSPKLADLVRDDGWFPKDAMMVKVDRFGSAGKRVLLGPSCATAPGGVTVRRLYSKHLCTAGYLVTRRGAEFLLAATEAMTIQIDHLLFDPERSPLMARLRPYQLLPALVQGDLEEVGSDLSGGRVEKRESGKAGMSVSRKAWLKLRNLPRKTFSVLRGARRMAIPLDG